MEMGVTAIMANTAIATSGNLVQMAEASALPLKRAAQPILRGLAASFKKGPTPRVP